MRWIYEMCLCLIVFVDAVFVEDDNFYARRDLSFDKVFVFAATSIEINCTYLEINCTNI